MNSKNPTIPEILYAGLIKLGITDQEHLKVILLTLQTEDNMAGRAPKIAHQRTKSSQAVCIFAASNNKTGER